MDMTWIDGDELRRRLPPDRAFAAIELALEAMAAGTAETPARYAATLGSGTSLLMAAGLPGALAVKVLHVREENRSRGLPSLPGVVLLFDPDTGCPLAALDGPTLTGLRTAAIAAVATRHLARSLETVAILGAGSLAPFMVDALLRWNQTTCLKLWNRTPEGSRRLAEYASDRHPSVRVEVSTSPADVARNADVITLVTGSRVPLLSGRDVSPLAHINAMGAYRPTDREVATDLVARARVYVDTLQGCLDEAGDILIPAKEGQLDLGSVTPLDAVRSAPRPQGLTFFKSVGAAVFDAATALLAWAPSSG